MEDTRALAKSFHYLYLHWIPKAVTHGEEQSQSQEAFCPKWAKWVIGNQGQRERR